MSDEVKKVVVEEEDPIIYEKKGSTAIITMNRPRKVNAMNDKLYDQLYEALLDFHWSKDLKCCILTGAGGNFSSGGDLKWYNAETEKNGFDWRPNFRAYKLLQRITKPVIAVVDGYCLASAFNLAVLYCDFIICSDRAKFGIPAIKKAMTLGYPVPYAQHMTLPNAMYLTLTGATYTAQDAYRIGLVQEVVPAEKLMDRAMEIGALIDECSILHLAAQKSLQRALADNPGSGQKLVDIIMEPLNDPEVMKLGKEGREAFLEKRKQDFSKVQINK